ncbi:MAG: translocation/assembly module TamB domain-containing protein [Rikenellaceae bacterium]
MPIVQNRILSAATTWASGYLGTKVDIGRVNVGAFGKIKFRDIYVEDYQPDTLLYLSDVELFVSKVSISSKQINIGSGSVKGGQLNLRQMQDSVLNLKQIIERLTPETPAAKTLVLSFDNLSVEDFDVSLDMLTHRNPEYGVDYGDMAMEGLVAEVGNLTIDGPTIYTTIKSFAFRERSGFELIDMSGSLYLSNGVISIEGASMESRYSQINLPHVMVVGTSWPDYKNFIEDVDMDVRVQNSILSSDDVAYFAPRLRDWGLTIYDLDLAVDGTVDDMNIDIANSIFEEGSALAADIHITKLPDIKNSYITAKVKECMANPTDIENIYTSIVGREFSEAVLQKIYKLDDLRYSADFEGTFANFAANLDASSSIGMVHSSVTMSEGRNMEGYIEAEDLNVGALIDVADIGAVTLKTELRGDVSDPMRMASANGQIESMELRGNTYYNITYGGWMADRSFTGQLRSRNTAMDFDIFTSMLFEQDGCHYDINATINNLDLKSLGVNKRDSVADLSTLVHIVGVGDNIENLSGDLSILDFEYKYNEKLLGLDKVYIHASNDETRKSFELTSQFADVTYRSYDSYKVSFDYLSNSLRNYLPALYGLSEEDVQIDTLKFGLENLRKFSSLSVRVKDLNPITDAVSNGGIDIADGSSVDVMYNPTSRDLSMSLKSPYIELNSMLAIDINIDARNNMDSLAMYGSIKELLMGTRQLDDVAIMAGANKNQVKVKGGYSDLQNEGSASLFAMANISNDPMRGKMASVKLLPSYLTQGKQMWNVKARNIEIDKYGVLIDRFQIQNDEQEFLVEGLASRSTADTLRMDMHNFDLSILSSLTEAVGYRFEGVTNGDVVISSALYNMRVEADVLMDSVSVNTLPAPPMQLLADWDSKLNRAEISLTNRTKGDTLVTGYYIPSEVRYFATLSVDSLNIGLLDAPLGGIISNSTGYVDAFLTVSGQRRDAVVEGYLDVKGMETKIDYTNVTYRVPNARIDVKGNELVSQNARIYDMQGNSGVMNLSVDLQHLSNITYKVRLNVDDILALNTTLSDNDLFYGTMYTTGVVDIVGNKVGVNMDITATTNDNSEFFMPLSSKSNISTAEFIKFVSPKDKIDSTDLVALKKLSFESERRSRGVGGGNLNINMSLNVTPAASFQLVIDPTVGDVIRGRGEGRMNIRVNPTANIFDMYGDYTISEGNYLFTLRNIINKRFIINPGSTIQWTGDPLDAILDIEAIYKLKTSLQPLISDESSRSVPVDCIIELKDRLMQPEVSFDISLPTADPEQQAVVANLLNDQEAISRQFFYLMLANSFVSEGSGSSGSDFGVSTTAATGFELLTNQLSNWLSSSNYNVVIRYRPESDLSGDELDFGISRSLINNRLLVEVEGNYTNDSGDEDATASNFTGEAYITWLIDRSGALKLKGFTQTIDRFDENQGLQETGIGIYYKESFDNFKDLKERVKARFSRMNILVRDRKNDTEEEEDEEQEKE